MANLFYLPYRPVYDNAGISVPGAKAYFTLSPDSNTPTPIYSNSGLSTPRTNPVTANGVGKFPTIYLDPGVNYRVRIYDADATVGVSTPLEEFDPYVPGLFADADALEPVADAAAASATAAAASAADAEEAAASIADPASVAFYPAGTGAVARTYQSKLREIVSVTDFGAVGDGVTDDSAAFIAAQNYAASVARSGYAYNRGVPIIYVPFGVYYFGGTPFDVTWPVHWIGAGDGGASNAATVLKWNNTSSGLRIQYVDTTGDSGTQVAATHSGSGAIFEGFHFEGGFSTGTEAERHAVHARAKVLLRNCNFFNWAGDAIHVDATTVGAHKGNANLVKAENCWAENCRNGWTCEGNDDTNAGHLIGFSANSCRRWGILEASFLGNQIMGGHFDSNARTSWNSGAANHPCSYVSHGGNWYFAVHGQEVGASTNAPSGTTADNTWWGYWKAGAPDATTGVPAWTNGIQVRSGGPICVTGVNNTSTVFGPHVETNGVSQLDQAAGWFGGISTAGATDLVWVSAGVLARNKVGRLTVRSGGIYADGNLNVLGNLFASSSFNVLGPIGTTVQDATTVLGTRSTQHTLQYSILDQYGTVSSSYLSIAAGSGFGRSNDFGVGLFDRWKVNGTEIAKIDGNGVHGSLAITSSSATAGIGYETGAGGAVTQATSRSTGVTLNKVCGAITLVSAAGSATWTTFTVTNSAVAATDVIRINQKSGTDKYMVHVTKVQAGSFDISFATTGGTTTEQPVFNFSVIKAVAA